MKLPDFVLRFIGRQVADKLELQEGPMDSTKKWYTSKGVWTGVVTFLIGAYALVNGTVMPSLGHAPLPAIPEWVLTVLGAAGIYSRVQADTKIG